MKGIAVLPQGLEVVGAKELSLLGAQSVHPLFRCVAFEADIACFYRLHLQARLPFRILREISRFKCNSPASLFHSVQTSFDWETWLEPYKSFRVDVSGKCFGLPHSHFTALQVKNALVDFQRKTWGDRSQINLENPDICFHLHLSDYESVLSLDGSSGSLHRRGYRAALGLAPLKENVASGLIKMTGWDGSVPLVDPFCGSGTFLIEAARSILNYPSGLNCSFLFQNWVDFDDQIWKKELGYANSLIKSSIYNKVSAIIGCDKDVNIANQAKENVSSLGLNKFISIQNRDFNELEMPNKKGLIICNPPYGKRLGLEVELENLYSEFGSFLKKKASGWELWLLSGNSKLTKFLRMKATNRFPVSNGGIDCRWLHYLIH